MHVPGGYALVEASGAAAIVRSDLATLPLARWWEPGEPLAGARGREGATVLQVGPGLRGVARTYRRGGALGFLGRRYLDGDRAFAELRALAALAAAGVPVVTPLCAVRRRDGMFWRLRLVTELLAGAETLPAFVAHHPHVRRAAVRRAGEVVRQALAAGLRHPDLHPDNLIVREHGGTIDVRLIDLDKATLVASAGTDRGRADAACDRVLARMARYLERHARVLPARPQRTDRLRFLAALGLARSDRRAALRRLAPRVQRQVARHRFAWHE